MARSPLRLGLFLAALTLVCFAVPDRAQGVIRPRTEAIPGSLLQKEPKPFKALPPALQTREWVGIRSLATQRGVSTPLPAQERCFSMTATLPGEASQNAAFGTAALLSNTTGSNNTAVGTVALLHNINGGSNTAVGASALSNNTSGSTNTATGTAPSLPTRLAATTRPWAMPRLIPTQR